MQVISGITVLECSDFSIDQWTLVNGSKIVFLPVHCCEDCHSRAVSQQINLMENKKGLIYIRPPRSPSHPTWGVDWSLHLAAQVCCRFVDVVLAQPHDWWRLKATELKTDEAHKLHFYGSKTMDLGKWKQNHIQGASNAKEKKVKKVGKTCLLCGEPSEEDVCESCG